MSARDRLVLMAIAALAVLGAVWMLAVSPARKQASTLDGEVASVRGQLATVQGELAGATSVRARYGSAYASLVSLGKAVPTSAEVPGLMYTIDQAANHRKVQFTSISNGGASGSSASHSSSPPSSPAASGAAAQGAGLKQMPFTFIFSGSYQESLPPARPARRLHRAGPIRDAAGERTAAHDPGHRARRRERRRLAERLRGAEQQAERRNDVDDHGHRLRAPGERRRGRGGDARRPAVLRRGHHHQRLASERHIDGPRRGSGEPMTEMLESIKSDLLSRRMLPLLIALAVVLVAAAAYALSAGGSGAASPPAPAPSASIPAPASALRVAVAPANAHAAVAETPAGLHFQSQGRHARPVHPAAVPAGRQERFVERIRQVLRGQSPPARPARAARAAQAAEAAPRRRPPCPSPRRSRYTPA